MTNSLNPQEIVLQLVNSTNKCIFLTGKAGTGKTTLLKKILKQTHKKTVVVAPTGIAALNAGGVTAHSLFQLPFSPFIPVNTDVHMYEGIHFETPNTLGRNTRMAAHRQSVIRQIELLIIDEVSMLRADMLDAIDQTMRRIRRNSEAFGGVQVLFIGDLMQLPPVVKSTEWQVLKDHYESMFFFHAHAYKNCGAVHIELKTIYRQEEQEFISILNNLRFNTITEEDKKILNRYVKPNFKLQDHEGYIFLTTHNAKADKVNQKGLDLLETKEQHFEAEVVGEFPENLYPVDRTLRIKIGAQVMFIKNDTGDARLFYNGKIGKVSKIIDGEIFVHFDDENITISVPKQEWENKRYIIKEDSKEVSEEILGTFVHYPIKLAWAITIHKSQGLTFEKAVIDVQDVFQPGQAYVALSRLTSMEGLVLINPLQLNMALRDQTVLEFNNNETKPDELQAQLIQGKREYIHHLIADAFLPDPLLKAWRTHRFSYKNEAPNSEKAKHSEWAIIQYNTIQPLFEVAEKFQQQILQILNQNPLDIALVNDRLEKATAYFFHPMDKVYDELLRKIAEIQKIKRIKTYHNELLVLEELHCSSIIKMFKTKKLLALSLSDQVINKDNLADKFTENYRKNKLAALGAKTEINKITGQLKTKKTNAINSQPGVPVKNTIDTTQELWELHKDVGRIAELRKLTKGTIYSHLLVLLSKDLVKIEEILDEEKLKNMTSIFEKHHNEDTSLTDMKAIVGEKYSFEELRLFRTYWLKKTGDEKQD